MNQPEAKQPLTGSNTPGKKAAWAAAMGIDFWVARKPLPGAPAGHLVVPLEPPGSARARAANAASAPINQPAHTQRDAGSLSHTTPAAPPATSLTATGSTAPGKHTTAAREALRQARDGLASKPPRPEPKTGMALPQSGASAKHRMQAFELACARIGALLVVDEITGLVVTPSVYLNWLKAIALAMQAGSMPAGAPRTEVQRIAWPPESGAGMPKTPGSVDEEKVAATQMLLAWMQRQFPVHGLQRVLLMGNAASLLLGDSPAPGTVAGASRFGDLPALVTHGSCLLWREPLRKREFWQHLQSWQ